MFLDTINAFSILSVWNNAYDLSIWLKLSHITRTDISVQLNFQLFINLSSCARGLHLFLLHQTHIYASVIQ